MTSPIVPVSVDLVAPTLAARGNHVTAGTILLDRLRSDDSSPSDEDVDRPDLGGVTGQCGVRDEVEKPVPGDH